MKSIFSFSIALGMIFLYQSNIYGQGERVILGNTITLNEPPPSYFLNSDLTYRASDFINLLPDFSVKPGESCNILMESDPKMVLYDGSEYQNGGTPDNNYGGRVGKLEDNLVVTPTGALQYEVPFDLPSGVNGLTPELSLVYNSQAGDGIVGMGWSISGLSKITRTPYTYYLNQYSNAVSFSNQDQLYYNGNYLVKNADGDYYAENTDFSVIRPIDPTSLNEGFIVYKRDGKVYEYGVSENSRFYLQSLSIPLEWHIEKITDAYGNYIEFEYANDKAVGSFRPVKIRYTGNSLQNVNPFYEIRFTYAQDAMVSSKGNGQVKQIPYRTDTQRKYFISDRSSEAKFYTQITHQLSFVELVYLPTDEKLADYQMYYELEGELPKLHLKAIYPSYWQGYNWGKNHEESGSDKQLSNGLNPIRLEWENSTYTIDHLKKDFEFINTIGENVQKTVFPVNMNGEANTTDVVQVMWDNVYNKHTINLFKNTSRLYDNGQILVQFESMEPLVLGSSIEPQFFASGDINGDGIEEIIMVYNIGFNMYVNTYSGYSLTVTSKKLGTFNPDTDYTFLLSDFTGNGLSDLVWVSNDFGGLAMFFLTLSPDAPFSSMVPLDIDFSRVKEVLLGDFSGNKRNELLVMYKSYDINKTSIIGLTADNNTPYKRTPSFNFHELIPPQSSYRFLTGDFNGDAKTDVLFINSGSVNNYQFYTSTGDDVFSEFITTVDESVINDAGMVLDPPLSKRIVVDINGDGFSDIAHFYYQDIDNIRKHYRTDYLLRLDYTEAMQPELKFQQRQLLDELGHGIAIDEYVLNTGLEHWRHFDYAVGNFTGYGAGQILSGRMKWTGDIGGEYDFGTSITGPVTYSMNQAVSKITDGYGWKRQIEYIPQTAKIFIADKGSNMAAPDSPKDINYPISIFRAPVNVVSKLNAETSENQFITKSYYYGMGKYHKLGKGFLGFDQIYTDDLANNTKIIDIYSVNDQFYQVELKEKQSYTQLNGFARMYEKKEFNYAYRSIPINNNLIYFPYLSFEKTTFYEKNGGSFDKEKTEDILYKNPDEYGNITLITQRFLNSTGVEVSRIEKSLQYDNFVSANRRLLGLLQDEVTTYKMTGEEDVIRRTNYTNNSTT
ncbi:MAG: SpvB/TcaC N-terminal domain-containing protein, partial [Bacteroidales bacterium]|nr:SpvB/TcaC N-terminal domain-containing protein [Bacteroidales bacterium]